MRLYKDIYSFREGLVKKSGIEYFCGKEVKYVYRRDVECICVYSGYMYYYVFFA